MTSKMFELTSLRALLGFDLPITALATLFGVMVGENAPVNSAKWAAISAIGTVLIAKFFQYARSAKATAVTVAEVSARREAALLQTFVALVHGKTEEKHDTANMMNNLILTLHSLKNGSMTLDEVDVNRLTRQASQATKPKPIEGITAK